MRTLTLKEILRFAGRPGVKRMAVENFLGSLADMSSPLAMANLSLDARWYGWNKATVWAIRDGITLAEGIEIMKGEGDVA